MSDLLDIRAAQALEAARAKLDELQAAEEAAIAAGDAAEAADRRAERMLMEEAALMLQQRRAGLAARLRALARHTARPPRKKGPKPMANAREIARKRQELMDAGENYGERSIADALGVSRDAVRYALGKDRRKPRT